MSGIDHKGRTPAQIIDTIMRQNGIVHESIGSKQKISNVTEAVQWLDQKLKTASKYDTGQKVAVGGASLGGGALGSVGGPIGGFAGAAVGAAGGYALGKVGRAGKSLYKKVRGTQGAHRMQAAEVLVREAQEPRRYRFNNSRIAYQVLQIWYDHQPTLDNSLHECSLSEEKQKAFAAEVAEQFRS